MSVAVEFTAPPLPLPEKWGETNVERPLPSNEQPYRAVASALARAIDYSAKPCDGERCFAFSVEQSAADFYTYACGNNPAAPDLHAKAQRELVTKAWHRLNVWTEDEQVAGEGDERRRS